MSAIWGCVDLSGTFVDPDIPDKMSECTKKYRIDQSQSVLFEMYIWHVDYSTLLRNRDMRGYQ